MAALARRASRSNFSTGWCRSIGGAAFVSLAAVTAASSVLPTVCIALEIPEAHGRSALDALCTVIGQRRMLIVLDNLEQVIDVAERSRRSSRDARRFR